MRFPSPPPLIEKPDRSAIPEAVRAKIKDPSRITRILFAFGVTGFLLVFVPAFFLSLLLSPFFAAHGISPTAVWIILGIIGWFGLSMGIHAGRKLIVEALATESSTL